MDHSSVSFWVQFGVAGLCLFALGGAVWKSVVWLANEIVKPAFGRGLKLLDALEEVFREILGALRGLGVQVDRIERKQDEHLEICSRSAGIAPPKG